MLKRARLLGQYKENSSKVMKNKVKLILYLQSRMHIAQSLYKEYIITDCTSHSLRKQNVKKKVKKQRKGRPKPPNVSYRLHIYNSFDLLLFNYVSDDNSTWRILPFITEGKSGNVNLNLDSLNVYNYSYHKCCLTIASRIGLSQMC